MKSRLVLILTWGTLSLAAAKLEYVLENGKPVEMHLDNGRVATFQIARPGSAFVAVPFEITENTCTGKVDVRCYAMSGVGYDIQTMTWTQHPDTAKLGKTLNAVPIPPFGGMAFELINQLIFGPPERDLYPIIAGKLPNEQLVCDDFSWLSQVDGKDAPENLTLLRWDTEGMVPNPETGLMENESLGFALNLDFVRTDARTLTMTKVGKYTGATLNFFFGDTWAWIFRRNEDQLCQVSIKPNLVAAQKELFDKLGPATNLKFEPYLWQSDEHSGGAKPYFLNFDEGFLSVYKLE